tara:strand:- start:9856 stop:10776 length:921 start_codon:yes stop_codon:yes gene_type:complete
MSILGGPLPNINTSDFSSKPPEGSYVATATSVPDKAVEPKFNLFSTPSLLSVSKFATGAISSYFGHKIQGYEAERQSAEAKRQYWEQWRATSESNYKKYNYELKAFYRETDYVEKRRQYEQEMKKQQSEYKGEVAMAATENLGRQIADIEATFYEEEAKDAMEIEINHLEAEAKAAKRVASGQVGRSVDASRKQYYEQFLTNLGNKTITKKFRVADKILNVEAEAIAADNATRELRDYTPQPIADPIKPVAPTPVRGFKPADTPGPSSLSLTTDIINQGFQAIDRYHAMQPKHGNSATGTENEDSN